MVRLFEVGSLIIPRVIIECILSLRRLLRSPNENNFVVGLLPAARAWP